ncbi:MAG: hypothetical protein IPO99_18135 [Nitrospira sp.]|nr:hypothetical protein [Nitrospira sp.]
MPPLRRQQIIEGGLVLPLDHSGGDDGCGADLLFVMLKMPLGLTTVILGHIVFNIPLVTIMIPHAVEQTGSGVARRRRSGRGFLAGLPACHAA